LSSTQQGWGGLRGYELLEVLLQAAPDGCLAHEQLVTALTSQAYSKESAIFLVATSPVLSRTQYGRYQLRLS
jgi:hypothetical protein